eukprot:TRINITY_DN25358_c0_g1_i1.p1 TRINITY_DN25358_c0_g1~~TRINITY_DN25358_c0_g1_i1.p1  ORF type:complete len:111 (-),score=20.69 TRINITY_DN25358_c0_g1_i1:128-460(-)
MHILDEAEGISLFLTAMEKPKKHRKRILELAASTILASCSILSHNLLGQVIWARTLYELSRLFPKNSPKRLEYLELALEKFQTVMNSQKQSFSALKQLPYDPGSNLDFWD